MAQHAQKFFSILKNTLPKSAKPESLYIAEEAALLSEQQATQWQKLDERVLSNVELYLKTIKQQDEYLERYNVGIRRDEHAGMEKLANKVGLTLTKLKTSKPNTE